MQKSRSEADDAPDRRQGTGGDPAGGADPGGTRSTKPGGRSGEAGPHVESGDRNDMTVPDPIKR